MKNVLEQLSSLTKVETQQTQPPQPVVEPVVVQQEPVLEPPVQQQQPIIEQQSTAEFQSEQDVINYLAQQMQIEGFIPTQAGVDAILELARHKVNAIEQQYEVFQRNEILEFKEHLEQGGTIDTFKQIQSLENPYEGLQYEEEDVETLEQLAKHIYVEIQGIDEEDAVALIESKKDNATLYSFVDKNITKLSTDTDAKNAEEKAWIVQQQQQQYQAQVEYTNQMKNAIKVNNFNGLKIPSNILPEIEKLSFADKDGKLGMEDVWQKLTPDQDILLNYFSYCLANGLPIEYKPIPRPNGTSKPIHQMFGVVSKEEQKNTSIKEFTNLLHSVRR